MVVVGTVDTALIVPYARDVRATHCRGRCAAIYIICVDLSDPEAQLCLDRAADIVKSADFSQLGVDTCPLNDSHMLF